MYKKYASGAAFILFCTTLAHAGLTEFSQSQFTNLLNAGKPVVVKFSAVWCGPCKQIAAPFTEVANDPELSGVTFFAADIDQADGKAVSGQYGVMGVPTIILFANGQEVDRQVGIEGGLPAFKNAIRSKIQSKLLGTAPAAPAQPEVMPEPEAVEEIIIEDDVTPAPVAPTQPESKGLIGMLLSAITGFFSFIIDAIKGAINFVIDTIKGIFGK